MASDLKPCPFCGGEPSVEHAKSEFWIDMRGNVRWQVACPNKRCGACGPVRRRPGEAKKAWNRRAGER